MSTKVKWDKKSVKREVSSVVRMVLTCFVIVYLISQFVVKPVEIVGESMHPTLKKEEFGFSNVIATYIFGVDRFEIVSVHDYSKTGDGSWVKRVIGLPNETIEYRNDLLYIDGKIVEEDFFDEDYVDSKTLDGKTLFTNDFGPITLKDDEYFLMGDNRKISKDSRIVGPFNREAIVSKGVFVLY